jgi:hypothetical protein
MCIVAISKIPIIVQREEEKIRSAGQYEATVHMQVVKKVSIMGIIHQLGLYIHTTHALYPKG